MLTGPDHLVALYMLCNGSQDDLINVLNGKSVLEVSEELVISLFLIITQSLHVCLGTNREKFISANSN